MIRVVLRGANLGAAHVRVVPVGSWHGRTTSPFLQTSLGRVWKDSSRYYHRTVTSAVLFPNTNTNSKAIAHTNNNNTNSNDLSHPFGYSRQYTKTSWLRSIGGNENGNGDGDGDGDGDGNGKSKGNGDGDGNIIGDGNGNGDVNNSGDGDNKKNPIIDSSDSDTDFSDSGLLFF
jgi:hypothetical protein